MVEETVLSDCCHTHLGIKHISHDVTTSSKGDWFPNLVLQIVCNLYGSALVAIFCLHNCTLHNRVCCHSTDSTNVWKNMGRVKQLDNGARSHQPELVNLLLGQIAKLGFINNATRNKLLHKSSISCVTCFVNKICFSFINVLKNFFEHIVNQERVSTFGCHKCSYSCIKSITCSIDTSF